MHSRRRSAAGRQAAGGYRPADRSASMHGTITRCDIGGRLHSSPCRRHAAIAMPVACGLCQPHLDGIVTNRGLHRGLLSLIGLLVVVAARGCLLLALGGHLCEARRGSSCWDVGGLHRKGVNWLIVQAMAEAAAGVEAEAAAGQRHPRRAAIRAQKPMYV